MFARGRKWVGIGYFPNTNSVIYDYIVSANDINYPIPHGLHVFYFFFLCVCKLCFKSSDFKKKSKFCDRMVCFLIVLFCFEILAKKVFFLFRHYAKSQLCSFCKMMACFFLFVSTFLRVFLSYLCNGYTNDNTHTKKQKQKRNPF